MGAKITLILHYGGRFTPRASDGKVEYIGREFDVWEDISIDYMNIFILCDLVQAFKKYSRIGDCFWFFDKDLDFNHGLILEFFIFIDAKCWYDAIFRYLIVP